MDIDPHSGINVLSVVEAWMTARALIVSMLAAGALALPSPAAAEFNNGPGELPQILRFEGRVITGWVDFKRGTGIIIGAPLDPTTSRICGGTVRNQFMPMQLVGDFEDVVKQIVLEQEANVLVYDEIAPSLEDALCGSTPAGVGQGTYQRSDNDLLGTGGERANAFMEHVHADLIMADGSDGVVNATLHGNARNGALVFVETSVLIGP
jgi:hypothetical protein